MSMKSIMYKLQKIAGALSWNQHEFGKTLRISRNCFSRVYISCAFSQ